MAAEVNSRKPRSGSLAQAKMIVGKDVKSL